MSSLPPRSPCPAVSPTAARSQRARGLWTWPPRLHFQGLRGLMERGRRRKPSSPFQMLIPEPNQCGPGAGKWVRPGQTTRARAEQWAPTRNGEFLPQSRKICGARSTSGAHDGAPAGEGGRFHQHFSCLGSNCLIFQIRKSTPQGVKMLVQSD